MKKMLTLALVALSAVAAQAVTYTWTGSNNNTATVSQLDDTTLAAAKTEKQSVVGMGADTTFTPSDPTWHAQAYAMAILFDGSAAGDIIRYTSSYTALNMGFSISGLVNDSTSNSATTTLTYADGMSADSVSSLITSGSNTLVVEFAVTTIPSSTYTTTTLTYYLNGEEIGSTIYEGGVNVDYALLNSEVFALYSIEGDADYARTNTYTEETSAEANAIINAAAANATDILITNLVPEPTCLALLALGVAGLALKRKVA